MNDTSFSLNVVCKNTYDFVTFYKKGHGQVKQTTTSFDMKLFEAFLVIICTSQV